MINDIRNAVILNSDDHLLAAVIIAFAIAAVIACAMTPVSIWVARRIGAIDVPRDNRRVHKKPIPRFGGMAIALGATSAILLLDGVNEQMRVAALGGALMYVLGAVDDLKQLKAWIKFICQTAIAVLMCYMGIKIEFIANYFSGHGNVVLGDGVSYVITVLWIVGVTNAINLMDGLDGLAAGISAIISCFLAYVAYIHSGDGVTTICIALMAVAGASIGFLPFNFNPAKTFMGDGGALYLGFMISILSVISPLKRATFVAALVPIFALGLPIFDTIFAIVRRLVRGEGIMSADKGHIHHRIMRAGFGQRRSVMIIYGIVAIMGMAAVMVSRELYKEAVGLGVIAAMFMLVLLKPHREHIPTESDAAEEWVKIAKPEEGESEWVHEDEGVKNEQI